MKRLLLLVCAFALLPQTGAAQSTAADSAGIRQAALDYIEGWWTGDAERMTRALHPELAKRAVAWGEDGKTQIRHTGADDLIRSTGLGRGTSLPPEQRRAEVEILDIYGDIATVRLASTKLIDYLHLVRSDGQWVIVNVLWDRQPRLHPALRTRVLDLPLAPEDIARYEGTYAYQSGTRTVEFRVFGENGQLNVQPGNGKALQLRYQGSHAFIPVGTNTMVLVFDVGDGRAAGLTLHNASGPTPAKRKP